MDMRTYMMKCLERHLSDYDLEGIELCDEDVDVVERLMKEKEMTLNNAVDLVLAGIYNSCFIRR